jgi:hypothetical protein
MSPWLVGVLRQQGGWLNLMLVVTRGDRRDVKFLTREAALAKDRVVWLDSDRKPAAPMRINLGQNNPDALPITAAQSNAALDLPVTGAEVGADFYDTVNNTLAERGCGYKPEQDYTQYTKVGEVHATPGVYGTFDYGNGNEADSTFGLAEYAHGGWAQAGGEVHIGKSQSSSFDVPFTGADDQSFTALTQFLYRQFKLVGQGCSSSYIRKFVKAIEWVGSSQIGALYTGHDEYEHHCRYSPYAAPESRVVHRVTRNSEQAVTYGDGVDLGFITMYAHSGYSSHVTATWNHPATSRWVLCGDTDYPPKAKIVYAGWGPR